MVTEKTDGHKSTISKLTDWEKKEGLVVVASLFDIKKIAGEGWDQEGQEAFRQQI